MKNIIISTVVAAFAFTSCTNSGTKSTENKSVTKDSIPITPEATAVFACSMHPEITGKKGDKCSKCGMELTEIKSSTMQTPTTSPVGKEEKMPVSIKEIVTAYLQLKNALTKDNNADAASKANSLGTAFKTFNKTSLTAAQMKFFENVEDDASEHAEHIATNGKNIAHQREHFEMLSKDVYDLVKTFGGGQTLYKDFCPMYNNNKGAFWVSETKEIKNPYLGKSMPTCGTLKEELK